MNLSKRQISVKGKTVRVATIKIDNSKLFTTGKILKILQIEGEWYEPFKEPSDIIKKAKKSKIRADVLTFIQSFPDSKPKYNYPMEWDNVAAIQIKDYEYWFKQQIVKQTRSKIRKAQKIGIQTKIVELNDQFIEGVRNIYNETPIRQGKPFWHYNKDFQTIKRELSDRIDKADFIGAYIENELIGFIKLLYSNYSARSCLFLSKIKHRDKGTNNILLAKAVEITANKKIPYLVYGQFIYGNKGSDSLTVFKKNNGFKKIDIPRYYVPLTLLGKLAIKTNLHHGFISIIPKKVLVPLIKLRNKWYEKNEFF